MYTQAEEKLNVDFTTGNEQELKTAIELYGSQLFRYAFNLVCDYHEAQDMVQLAFIKAYQNRNQYTANTSLIAWLYRITYTTCINHLRKQKWSFMKEADLKNNTYDLTIPGIDQDIIDAMLKLKPADRAIVYGRVVLGHSYSDLENILGLSQANLRKRYERAKGKLALHLQENPQKQRKETPNGTIKL